MIPVTKQTSLSSALLNSDFYEVRSTLWLLGIKEKELDENKRSVGKYCTYPNFYGVAK